MYEVPGAGDLVLRHLPATFDNQLQSQIKLIQNVLSGYTLSGAIGLFIFCDGRIYFRVKSWVARMLRANTHSRFIFNSLRPQQMYYVLHVIDVIQAIVPCSFVLPIDVVMRVLGHFVQVQSLLKGFNIVLHFVGGAFARWQ